METVKTSIFKQEIFENKYVLSSCSDWIETYKGKLVEEKEIFRCDIPLPLLKQGETFYIEESDLIIIVRRVIRTSKGNILYLIDDKCIDTDDSLKQKEELTEIIKKSNENKILRLYNSMSYFYKFFVSYEKFKAMQKYSL